MSDIHVVFHSGSYQSCLACARIPYYVDGPEIIAFHQLVKTNDLPGEESFYRSWQGAFKGYAGHFVIVTIRLDNNLGRLSEDELIAEFTSKFEEALKAHRRDKPVVT